MLYALAIAVLYSLLTFGAVLRHSWLILAIYWLGCVTSLLIFRGLKDRALNLSLILLATSTSVLFLFLQPKFAVGLTAALWSFVAVISASDKRHVRTLRFFHILLLIGVLEALLGLVQFFVSPGWILGYISPFSRSSGTLINRNHFAGLLEMLIPIAWGFAYISVRRERELARPYTYLIVGSFISLALLFSLSRTGVFSLLVTVFVMVALLRVRKSDRRVVTGLSLGFLLLLIGTAGWIGFDAIVARYAELTSQDAILRDGRIIVYRDTIQLIRANPGGIGSGNYQDFFRKFQTFHPDVLFDHAHNDYLETMAEWGIAVATIFWMFVFFVLASAVRAFLGSGSPERQGVLLSCIGSIFSILVHSLSDFNLQIPVNAMLFFTFVGIAAAYAFSTSKFPMANGLVEN